MPFSLLRQTKRIKKARKYAWKLRTYTLAVHSYYLEASPTNQEAYGKCAEEILNIYNTRQDAQDEGLLGYAEEILYSISRPSEKLYYARALSVINGFPDYIEEHRARITPDDVV